MIFDFLKNLGRYGIIPHLKAIQDFLLQNDCARLKDGELEILGRDLFVRIAAYPTALASEKKFEAHQIYADLQYLVSGSEIMYYSLENNPAILKPATGYDSKADIQFFDDIALSSSVQVSAGQFTFFFPGELHMPGCHPSHNPSEIKKLVFKIKMIR